MKKDQLIALGERAEEYIRERLSEKLDRDTICRALSTNRTTLSSALILRTGRTLKRFILDERIRLARYAYESTLLFPSSPYDARTLRLVTASGETFHQGSCEILQAAETEGKKPH